MSFCPSSNLAMTGSIKQRQSCRLEHGGSLFNSASSLAHDRARSHITSHRTTMLHLGKNIAADGRKIARQKTYASTEHRCNCTITNYQQM